jgi:hypothetical protein
MAKRALERHKSRRVPCFPLFISPEATHVPKNRAATMNATRYLPFVFIGLAFMASGLCKLAACGAARHSQGCNPPAVSLLQILRQKMRPNNATK